jgi:hypothetical protein
MVEGSWPTHMNDPNTAPPENVALIAPMMLDLGSVLKKLRKWGDWMTTVMTPLSYPNKKLPLAAKIARPMLNQRPIFAADQEKSENSDLVGREVQDDYPSIIDVGRSCAVVVPCRSWSEQRS